MFIITAGEDKRLILHARTSRTYELICAVDDEDSLFSALKRFCRRFRTELQMREYIKNFQSDSTKQGIIYREYNKELKKRWETFFAPFYEKRIEHTVDEVFAGKVVKPSCFKKRFKIVRL